MGKIPQELREIIGDNIRECRMKKFPGRGGSKKCAAAFGVSPQQWSPWERGMRTPDELRMKQIADFFGTNVEWLRKDHRQPVEYTPPPERPKVPDFLSERVAEQFPTEQPYASDIVRLYNLAKRVSKTGFTVTVTINFPGDQSPPSYGDQLPSLI